eukprot:3138820-Prymnesium_polylepis.1
MNPFVPRAPQQHRAREALARRRAPPADRALLRQHPGGRAAGRRTAGLRDAAPRAHPRQARRPLLHRRGRARSGAAAGDRAAVADRGPARAVPEGA